MKVFKIYKITNKINNKTYIGQTCMSIKKRWAVHKCTKSCRALGGAINKYGSENFIIEWIASSNDKYKITELEDYFMKTYNSIAPNGYNIKPANHIGDFNGNVKERMSESQKIRHNNMTKEEKDLLMRGAKKYVESKKRPIIGINKNHKTIKFPTVTEAYSAGYFPENSLQDQYSQSAGYMFFYQDEYTFEDMIAIFELSLQKRREKQDKANEIRLLAIKKYFEENAKQITAVNLETKDILTFDKITDALKNGFSHSSVYASLDPNKLGTAKGYHFFYTNDHTLDEMWQLAEIQAEAIKNSSKNSRAKAQANLNMQKHIESQKVKYIGINPKTKEYQIFDSQSAATKAGYNSDAMRRGARGEKRKTKGLHFQRFTLSIEEHIQITLDIFKK